MGPFVASTSMGVEATSLNSVTKLKEFNNVPDWFLAPITVENSGRQILFTFWQSEGLNLLQAPDVCMLKWYDDLYIQFCVSIPHIPWDRGPL